MVGKRTSPLIGRRLRLLIVLAMVAGLMGLGTMVSAQENPEAYDTSGLTPVTITFTSTGEVIDPGVEYEDESGFHFRGSTEINDVSGDVTGTATLTFNGDIIPLDPEQCTEEECPGTFNLWVTAEIETEAGQWDGFGGFVSTSEEDFDDLMFMLVGRGANAGNVILLDTVVEETEDGITFSGYLLTVDRAVMGINAYVDICLTGPDTISGGFLFRSGDSQDSGSVGASITTVGAPQPGVIFGRGMFEGENGSMNVVVIEQTHGEHAFGHFVILGGTGAYDGLYGWGHTKGSAVAKPGCATGIGFNEYLFGEATYK